MRWIAPTTWESAGKPLVKRCRHRDGDDGAIRVHDAMIAEDDGRCRPE